MNNHKGHFQSIWVCNRNQMSNSNRKCKHVMLLHYRQFTRKYKIIICDSMQETSSIVHACLCSTKLAEQNHLNWIMQIAFVSIATLTDKINRRLIMNAQIYIDSCIRNVMCPAIQCNLYLFVLFNMWHVMHSHFSHEGVRYSYTIQWAAWRIVFVSIQPKQIKRIICYCASLFNAFEFLFCIVFLFMHAFLINTASPMNSIAIAAVSCLVFFFSPHIDVVHKLILLCRPRIINKPR